MTATLGIDIGGTQLRAALVDPAGRILDRHRRPTPAEDPTSLIATLVELVEEVREQQGQRVAVGIGIAGLVTADGVVKYGPNIGIRDLSLAARVTEGTGAEVVVANDASVAALGEQRSGAGRNHRDLVLVTIGTGIGGGIVVAGRLVSGSGGFAGEFGHVVVQQGGRPCPCGNRGCIEAYASGTAIGAIARDRLVDPAVVTSLRELDRVSGPDVTAAARNGDTVAIEVLTEVGTWLGVGLAGVVNVLDPEVVLLGGGAAEAAAPWMIPTAESAMASHLVGSRWRTPPPIRLAELGDDAGVVGAAMLAADTFRQAE